ncbi:CRISPR-associated endonuclease Cas3'' [Tetragenococcus muriaticus]|uniref:CRISPR-associated Cas3 family helicase n=1 Tax=Tetragenococcus muriaticus 3MR10-3 TaxID=1302648 RepID=A0A091BWF4_9ENTE|nr:CRISPR-associated endonuclease Cas3'' [Tetragenococcus muriaticus]KFN89074.1 CRISPR-associated Cas3 family helicase [Tetragenococcus muriaticus 3MR10-3]
MPLSQHLEDTYRVSERLWELWLNKGQRKLVIDSLSSPTEERAKQLVQFLAAVHDMAKATPAFQIKKGFANSADLDIQLLERLERSGFNGITKLKLPSPNKSPHALAGETLLSWYGVNEDVHSIISGHHGKPVDRKKEYEQQSSYLENYFQEESSNSPIYQKWQKVQYEIFQWALQSSGFAHISDLPNITQPGQVILSGLLIMSDWIASNEEFFPIIDYR